MREYAKRGHRVFFVEAALTWMKLLKGRSYWTQILLIFKGARVVEDGVIAVMMPPFFPGGEWISTITELNWLLIRLWLKLTIYRQFKIDSPRLFLFAPTSYLLVGKLGETVSIYYCNDPFAALFRFASARKTLDRMENELTRRVDVVFAVSDKLVEDRKAFNPRTFLVPHAVDSELYAMALDPNTVVPADIAACPKPVFGHVGVLNIRIDVPFVKAIAEKMPESSFVFIGPIIEVENDYRKQLLSLDELPNVFFLGDKREEELPRYLKGIDVCMVPYIQAPMMKYIRANAKFYQFVAAGRPVVSTVDVLGFEDEIVISAHDPESFVQSLKRAINFHSPAHIQKRLALAGQNTHSARVDMINNILSTLPERKTK